MSGSHKAVSPKGARHVHHHPGPPPRSSPTSAAPTTERRPVWKHGVAAAAVATVATTVLAAIASAAGVSFADSSGESIPVAAFPQLTLIFSLIGVGIAAVMARKARRPRSTFVRTAVALTALSYVPDLTFGFDAASAATLIAAHTVAAAIVVADPGAPAQPHPVSQRRSDATMSVAGDRASEGGYWSRLSARVGRMALVTSPQLEIAPDTKDWTWVLERRAPSAGSTPARSTAPTWAR